MSNTAEVIEHPTPALVPQGAITPMEMLSNAIERNLSPEVLGKLMDLSERWEKNQARKAFDEAMSAAKADIPVIRKNRTVGYDHKDGGGKTSYRHEDLGEIAGTIDPILAKHGLSYRFRVESPANAPVSVTCIISHRLGHFEETTLSAGRDESGKKNSIQAIGSTITYLQRYTLKAVLGLAASADDDGKASEAESVPVITADQDDAIKTLIAARSNPGAALEKFLSVFKIESTADLPAKEYERAVALLKKPAKQADNAS